MTVSGMQVLQLLVLVFVLGAARCEAGFLRPINYAVGWSPGSIVVADFNGDGNQDMAVVNFFGGSLSVMLGNGDGTFQSNTLYPTGGRPYSLATEDFNGDGKLDLAVANLVDATVSVLLNRGDGTFLPRTDYPVQGAYSVATGDFNEDGNPDLAVANGLDSGSINV